MNQQTLDIPHSLSPNPVREPSADSVARASARQRWEVALEVALEWLIRLCGISAILFVFGIFIFVFREGAGVLFSGRLSLRQFLFSTEW
jgi:ABC-type phosphate transport system permease subunit